MASTYTLDEAAQKLNVTVEEFRRRLRDDWKNLRSFRDGSTLRFRAQDIDELARSLGEGSSELQLNIVEDEPEDTSDPDIIKLVDDDAPPKKNGAMSGVLSKNPPKAKPPEDDPLPFDSDEIFLLPDESKGVSSSKIIPPKSGSDSDIRLEQASGPRKPAPDDDDAVVLTEEIELPSAGGSGKLTSGKSGKIAPGKSGILSSGNKQAPPPEEDSSEFELSLEEDSSEFELSIEPDSSEEISLDLPPPKKGQGGRSGILSGKPNDSGVSLEKKSKQPDSDEDIDFELSLDTPGASSKKITGKQKQAEIDSDSEFELTLEDPSDLSLELETSDMVPPSKPKAGGDIFEATDFEIPALDDDSASEVVSLDDADTDLDSSEFDLALDENDASFEDESSSQVVALDDDDLDIDEDQTVNNRGKKGKAKAKAKKKASDDEDLDLGDMDLEADDDDVSSALADVSVDDDDDDVAPRGRQEPVYIEKKPAKWGIFPVLFMFPTFVIVLVGGLIGWETVRGAWGYTQPTKPTAPLTKAIAGALDLEMKEFDK